MLILKHVFLIDYAVAFSAQMSRQNKVTNPFEAIDTTAGELFNA